MYVYRLYCRRSRKSYIGVAKDVSARFAVHRKAKSAIGAALRKYGVRTFSIRVLFQGTPEDCYKKEVEYIARFRTVSPGGYNLTAGGEGVRGHAPEVLNKMSRNIARALRRPQTRLRLSDKAKAQWKDPDQLRRNREGNRRAWADPSRLAAHGERMREINSTPVLRSAASLRAKKQWADPEFRAAQSRRMKSWNAQRLTVVQM